MTGVKLLFLYNSTRNHLTVSKECAQACLKMLSTECVDKSWICYI